jgi:hypothetical protein
MKLLMENWRKFISEEEIEEAALGMGEGGLNELGDITFSIEKDDGEYMIVPRDGQGNDMGFFDLDGAHLDCGYYQTHSHLDDPSSKLGPFAYDLLIELGTLLGGWVAPSGHPSGATYEKKAGENAISVWIHYYEKRNDLQKRPIELDGNCWLQKDRTRVNTLSKLQNRHPEKYMQVMTAILHKYQKKPIFLSQLKKMGKLEAPDDILNKIPGETPQQPKQFKLSFDKKER